MWNFEGGGGSNLGLHANRRVQEGPALMLNIVK